MNRNSSTILSRSVTTAVSALLSGTCLLAIPAISQAEQGVLVSGVQTSYDEFTARGQAGMGGNRYTVDDLCAVSGSVGMAMERIVSTIDQAMVEGGSPLTLGTVENMPGAPNRVDVSRDLANARDQVCDTSQPPETVEPFVITYSACRMTMTTPNHAMVMEMPAGSNDAYMMLADGGSQEVMQMNLTGEVDDVSAIVGSGWNNLIDMQPNGESKELNGYQTRGYTFEYNSGLGDSGSGSSPMGAISGMVSIKSTGTAWVSDSAPGTDIVATFYRNLTGRVQAAQNTSFFGGMIENMVGMLEQGMPIVIDQSTESKIMGRTQAGGRSKSIVNNIRLTELRSDWCSPSEVPAGYTVTDASAQMSEAMAGAPSSEEMEQAMQQYNEAMQGMTDEQRQMMEQFGMGDMLEQMTGGAAGQAGGSASAAAAASPSGSMDAGELTASVQQNLQALGYDTGNTSGEMSLETTIAISQFQAEHGLEVTGEVSPQLAGRLSAEVGKSGGN